MPHRNVLTSRGSPLIKFQSADRIESLRSGKIYAKNLGYYRNLERTSGDADIGDQNEGMLPVVNATIENQETGERLDLTDTRLETSESNDFVFCIFKSNPQMNGMRFTAAQKARMLTFGDTALLILDPDEFVNRVTQAATDQGFEVHYDSVKYYDPEHDNARMLVSLLEGMWNIAFWKRNRYAYQQEARFVFTPGNDSIDHIELDVGDLHDITEVFKASDVLNTMQLQN